MKRISVSSSQIKSVGHDKATQVLEIEFNDGSVYQYQNVDAVLYKDMVGAASIGGFFGRAIKNKAAYPCTKLIAQNVQYAREGKDAKKVSATPDPKLVASVALTMPERARKFLIRDNQDYVRAAEFLKSIKALRGEVDAAFGPIITKAHETHKAALEQKRVAEQPLVEAEAVMKRTVGDWLRVKEDERVAEERRLRAENEARIRAQAEEENLKEAQRLADAGDMEGAAAAVDAEVVVPVLPVHVESTAVKVAGISMRKVFKAEVTDLMTLVRAVAAGSAPLQCLAVNQVFLNAQARAYKAEGLLFPGVEIVADDSIAAGRS